MNKGSSVQPGADKPYIIAKECAGIGPGMDLKSYAGRLYIIQRANLEHNGRLCVLDRNLKLLSSFEGIGNARQIEIVGETAVITSREDGVFIFDISDLTPRLLSHYHSVEYATGVALCGNLAFVSCRQYGVEMIDISDPRAPRFVSLVRVGEVQSATVSDGYLYCGVWGEMKVVVVDVHQPDAAYTVAEIPLQGRGDGVCVHDGKLYAATGQHARGIANVTDHTDPHFGMGNGVEVFDVRDPANPRRLGGTLFEKAYFVSIDMWEAAIYGKELMVNNSILGIYVMDPEDFTVRLRIKLSDDLEIDAVTGATSLDGDLFFTTAYGDIFAVRGAMLSDQMPNDARVCFPSSTQKLCVEGDGAQLRACYAGNFSVTAVAEMSDTLVLACEHSGIHLIDRESFSSKVIIKTADQAKDVAVHNGRLFVAEGLGGVEIFDWNGTDAVKVGEISDADSINQLLLSQSGRYLLCAIGAMELRLYDVGASEPKLIDVFKSQKGLIYGGNFAKNLLSDGTMVAFCHRDGLLTANPDAGNTTISNIEYTKLTGFCGYCGGEGIGVCRDRILYTFRQGYAVLSEKDTPVTPIESVPHYTVERGFGGFLTVGEHMLAASNRSRGLIRVVDVKDLEHPVVRACIKTNANPSAGIPYKNGFLLPGGRQGLLQLLM